MSANVYKNDTGPVYECGGGHFPPAVVCLGLVCVQGCLSEASCTLAEELRVTVADTLLKVFSKFAN